MKKIALLFIPFLGILFAKGGEVAVQLDETVQLVGPDPRKKYRAKMAKQYFGGGGGGRCHKWNRFCGR